MPEQMGAQMFDKYRSHLSALGTVTMIHFKFHTDDPQILGGTVQNALAQVDWRPGFVKP
jgi:hypothetical protein